MNIVLFSMLVSAHLSIHSCGSHLLLTATAIRLLLGDVLMSKELSQTDQSVVLWSRGTPTDHF